MCVLFVQIENSVRLTMGLKKNSIHLWEISNINVFMNRIPCGVGISPRSRSVDNKSFVFLMREKDVNQGSIKNNSLTFCCLLANVELTFVA